MGSNERASDRAAMVRRRGQRRTALGFIEGLSVLFDSFCTSDAKKWIGKTILRITYRVTSSRSPLDAMAKCGGGWLIVVVKGREGNSCWLFLFLFPAN